MSTQPGPANPAFSLSTAPEPYVDVKRAASYLSVAVKTLNEWARLEKIPAYPWGDGSRKTWRFKLSELDEWMQRRIDSVRRPPLSEIDTRSGPGSRSAREARYNRLREHGSIRARPRPRGRFSSRHATALPSDRIPAGYRAGYRERSDVHTDLSGSCGAWEISGTSNQISTRIIRIVV